jgi:hypothetical protein
MNCISAIFRTRIKYVNVCTMVSLGWVKVLIAAVKRKNSLDKVRKGDTNDIKQTCNVASIILFKSSIKSNERAVYLILHTQLPSDSLRNLYYIEENRDIAIVHLFKFLA